MQSTEQRWNFLMSTSDELRAALNRRLKKIDTSPRASLSPKVNVASEHTPSRSVDSKEDALNPQTYRSGWAMTPPIPRSIVLPPPLSNPSSPTKSETGVGRVCVA